MATQWIYRILGGLLFYSCLVVLYRLRFHPLAKYPGPWLARITSLYALYHAWRGDRHVNFHRCHERYGDFVRLGPNYLSVNTNRALKDIYGTRANVRKSDWYHAFVPAKGGSSVFSSTEKATHARKR